MLTFPGKAMKRSKKSLEQSICSEHVSGGVSLGIKVPLRAKIFQDNLKHLQAATDQKTQGCNARIFSISGFSSHNDDF
jgi:hypothetical protein